jgi:hypothetical protein
LFSAHIFILSRIVFEDDFVVEPVGYAYLIDRYGLAALPLPVVRLITDAVPSRRLRDRGGEPLEEFNRSYEPEPTPLGHLRFALRYEGLNLAVLRLLFDRIGADEVQAALNAQPASVFLRRIAYLYEWLTEGELTLPDGRLPGKLRYVSVLDESLQFGLDPDVSQRIAKYKVIDNLPGTRDFCPLVRKTPYLVTMTGKGLKGNTRTTLEKYDRQLVMRAAAYLYLKETHSSFEVERVKPTATKAQRFADLLHEAETATPLSDAVVDPRWAEASYRLEQNWVGTDYGHRCKVDFVPPRPDDVRALMDGLVAMVDRIHSRPDAIDAVIAASAISFGFVFVHPFKDGNGRLHRYLIHEQLSTAGFTPKGIILPVSAVILANLDRYKDTLESFSRRVLERTSYDPAVPNVPATGNDAVYFRYFDATEQASFLYDALERTVTHDLDQEISFLLGFDRAQAALSSIADWPGHSLEHFIRVVRQNNGTLSLTKRNKHFQWMTDEELARFEAIVARAFDFSIEPGCVQPDN